MRKILVTGGAGFIGSHFVDRLAQDDSVTQVTVLDALTYAGSMANLGDALRSPKVRFAHGDICDSRLVSSVLPGHQAIVHFAAESHVDRSLTDADAFVRTNVVGTQVLLNAACEHSIDRFVHVSTDEVYGSWASGSAKETDPVRPSVPYAASKAASDLMALSAFQTHGLPVCVTRSSNNYGPRQYPEKVIPRFVRQLLSGQPLTIHGSGQHLRNWLHVRDNAAAIDLVLREGTPGDVYNIGGGTDLATRDLAERLVDLCGGPAEAIRFVPDRQANDLRYAMNWDKIRALGFTPAHDLEAGLRETIGWYRKHADRWSTEPVTSVVLAS
ncbi:dTDP-glucose 4,6-dehydratase [Streptomyces sp. NPDC002690]